jgi:hypothetical protein
VRGRLVYQRTTAKVSTGAESPRISLPEYAALEAPPIHGCAHFSGADFSVTTSIFNFVASLRSEKVKVKFELALLLPSSFAG